MQLQHWMVQQLDSGAWPPHFKLEAEARLAQKLGVARDTLRQAIKGLVQQGRLYQIHGRGTFVAPALVEQPLAQRLVSISEDLIERGLPFETEVIEQGRRRPDDRIASLLHLSGADDVIYLRRVRRIRGCSAALLDNYLPASRFAGLERRDFTKERLFFVIENIYRVPIAWARRTFSAEPADAAVARYLELSPGHPVLYLQQVTYDRSGRPVEHSDVWLRTDRLRLTAELRREPRRGRTLTPRQFGHQPPRGGQGL